MTLALELKQRHLNKHPQYAYQPRKPGDKKRRMTPKKAENLNTIASALVNSVTNTNDDAVDGATNNSGPTNVTTNHAGSLPDLSLDPFGCIGFVLGNPDISPETFEAMINANNDSLPPTLGQLQPVQGGNPTIAQAAPVNGLLGNWPPNSIANPTNGAPNANFLGAFAQTINADVPPIIDSEDTQEVRDSLTFFDETFGWQNWAEQLVLDDNAYCDEWKKAYDPQDLITEDQRCDQYDSIQHDLQLARIERQANL